MRVIILAASGIFTSSLVALHSSVPFGHISMCVCVSQMDSEAKRRQSWLTLQGYSAVAWDSVHPLAACARLQMLMDGLNPEDHAFLVRVGARQCLEATWQPYIAEGTILRQYSALKQMVCCERSRRVQVRIWDGMF